MNLIDNILSHFGYVHIAKNPHNVAIQMALTNQELLRKVSLHLPEFVSHYEDQQLLVKYLQALRRLI